ncbi:phage integrase central domain-containing protein [Microbulbifer mangrovi]|uniref:phage integrase central domain-containing protein n=1 Tax=Microbulbifer mangrovi TaxID=927787 RepID=UPI00117D165E|nr:hypothetical protein [Microbulbifer mangrovi]
MPLIQARVVLSQLKKARKEGIDPKEAIKELQPQAARMTSEPSPGELRGPTLADAVRNYIKQHLQANWKPENAHAVELFLEANVVDVMGERPLVSITSSDIRRLARRHTSRGKRSQAKKICDQLAKVFGYAKLDDMLPDDFTTPARSARYDSKDVGVKLSGDSKTRFFEDWEIREFYEWIHQPGIMNDELRVAMLVFLQIGCRGG